MPLRGLRFDADPVLVQVAAPVTRFDAGLHALVADLFDTMYHAAGRGLAAPQVGVLDRVFVMDITWKDAEGQPMAFVNPEIIAAAPTTKIGPEACLSIPDRTFHVARPVWVDMAWQTPSGAKETRRFDGIAAVCVCHELDHLNGVLITATGTEI